MREIFTDLYNKVLGFFQNQEKEEGHIESKKVAINRMKLVLMQDRTNLTPYLLERMRGEMIEVLAKYVEMDKEALELNFEQEGEQMALMLSIPVIRAKEEDEINAILEEEAKNKEQKAEDEAEDEKSEETDETQETVENESEEEVEIKDEQEAEKSEQSEEKALEEAETAETKEGEKKSSKKRFKKIK